MSRNRLGKRERERIRQGMAVDAAECAREQAMRVTGGAVAGTLASRKKDRSHRVAALTSGCGREGVNMDPNAASSVRLEKRLAAGQRMVEAKLRAVEAGVEWPEPMRTVEPSQRDESRDVRSTFGENRYTRTDARRS